MPKKISVKNEREKERKRERESRNKIKTYFAQNSVRKNWRK